MKVRVPLHGRAQGFATVDPSATNGAVVGSNLFWPDGTVVVAADFGAPAAADGSDDDLPRTAWSLILEVPPNVAGLGAVATDGFLRRDGAAISARALTAADVPMAPVVARIALRVR